MSSKAAAVTIALGLALSAAGTVHGINHADLDPSFAGGTGYNHFLKDDDDFGLDVVTAPDGTIYVAVAVEDDETADLYYPGVVSFTNTGSINNDFGTFGLYVIPHVMATDFIGSTVDVGLASDGKVYVSFPGRLGAGTVDFELARVKADGSGLDLGFGLLGVVGAAFNRAGEGLGDDWPWDLVVQGDGKIVVVGEVEASTPGDVDIGFARFTDGGVPDVHFDTDGRAVVWFDAGGSNADLAFGVTTTSNGGIVATGQTATGAGTTDLVVVALDSTGALDESFASGGMARYQYEDFGSGQTSAQNRGRAVTTLPASMRPADSGSRSESISDTIFVAGSAYDPTVLFGTENMTILCITGTGDPCLGFGMLGWAMQDFSSGGIAGIGETDDVGTGIVYDPTTGTVTAAGVAGQTGVAPESFIAVMRVLASNGTPVSSFGEGGKRYFAEPSQFYLEVSATLDNQDHVVIGSHNSLLGDYEVYVSRLAGSDNVFRDDFESGSTAIWSNSVGE